MSQQRRQRQAVNLALNRILTARGVAIESRYTSPSGIWVIVMGTRTVRGMPSFSVLSVSMSKQFVDQHNWDVSSTDGEYEEAKRSAYTLARTFYEDLCHKLQMEGQIESAEDNNDSGMEIIETDGTTKKYTIN